MDALSMLRMLARMPLEEQRFRQTEMLDMFFSMPRDRAVAMMSPIVQAKLALPEEEQLVLAHAQLIVLADHPAHKREWLLEIHQQLRTGFTESDRSHDQQITEHAIQRMEPERRERLMASLRRVRGNEGASRS